MIELLAVVSIIAVLAALLFPAVQKAQHKGKAAVCLSNLRELAGACALYSQDHDGKFPYGASEDMGSAWHSNIYQYVGKEGAPQGWNGDNTAKLQKNRYYLCPSDKNPYRGSYEYGLLSYAFNRTLKGLRRASISKSVVMLGEGTGLTYAFDIDNATTALGYRHHNGANFAFSDGRVEWHPSADVTEEFLKAQE